MATRFEMVDSFQGALLLLTRILELLKRVDARLSTAPPLILEHSQIRGSVYDLW